MTTQSNNNNNRNGNSHFVIACESPTIGEKLPDYIVDLLNDEEAFVIEQHLAECKFCKERYLLMLAVRSEAPQRGIVAAAENEPALPNDNFDGVEATNH
jgi:predicted anti-sigma-YlaC factor YlaD